MKRIDLKGKTVVLTGASGGIGGEAARAFARRGARLVLSGRNLEALDRAAARVRDLGAVAHVVAADVTSADEMKALAQKAVAVTGRLDVMFLGAGHGVLGEAARVPLESWREQIDVNFFGALNGFYAALPYFLERGSGRYVIMNSLSGRMAMALSGPYSASKYALWGFTDCARTELRERNIGVLAVYPYFVKTSFQANITSPDYRVPPDLAQKMLGQSPVKLGERIVRACERGQEEMLCTALGKIGTRIVPLSFHLSEWVRMLLLPLTRRVLGTRKDRTGEEKS